MMKLMKIIGAILSMHAMGISAFAPMSTTSMRTDTSTSTSTSTSTALKSTRRVFFESVTATTAAIIALNNPSAALAADDDEQEEPSVQTPLYSILRAREAMEQETRLIKSGRFKDVQRANVKLAVKFMVDNYRLNDNFIAASAFLSGDRKIKAVDSGTNVVQNLYTILEYFDASDVENIKVGSNSMAGKEALVLRGLDSSKRGIDDFLSYFPKDEVTAVVAKIEVENELNMKEFDKELNGGVGILNPKPTSS